MAHFKSNLRDIEFNLFEVLNRQDLLGSAPHEDLDAQTAGDILQEVNRLAAGPIAESYPAGDRNPPVFDRETASVRVPEAFAKSYHAFMDAEWFRLELPHELGGTAAPRSLCWAVAELILGANPAVWMYASGALFAHALWQLGTPDQRRFARQAVERRWTATMVLTGQAVHHRRRARPGREHLPFCPRPARGRWPRYQGTIHVPGAEVPGRPRRLAR